MKSDVRNNRYFINDQDILMIHHQHNGKDLIALPPEHIKAFLHYYHHHVGIHTSTTPIAK